MGVRDKFIDATEKFQKQQSHAHSDSTVADEREALQREAEDAGPEIPTEALHGLAGDVVRTIDSHTEASRAAVLAHFLVFFGNCVGVSPHYQVGGDEHRANLFAVLVGRSSKGRKGTSEGQIRRIFEGVDPDWSKKCLGHGLSSGEGVIKALESNAAGGEIRLLLVEPEFANVLFVMQRDQNTLSGVIRQAWDRGHLRVMTRKEPLRVDAAHVSIVAHVTASELVSAMDARQTGNGFANRFLWVEVHRSKFLPDPVPLADSEIDGIRRRLMLAIDHSRRTGEVKRDAAAGKLWAEVYPELSREESGLIGAVTSRAEAQVIRIALVYALLDCSSLILETHMRAALGFWRYCRISAERIFGLRLGNVIANRIWAEAKERPDEPMDRTEIRDLFGRNIEAGRLEAALQLLSDLRLMKKDNQRASGPGRPREIWRLLR